MEDQYLHIDLNEMKTYSEWVSEYDEDWFEDQIKDGSMNRMIYDTYQDMYFERA